MRCRKLKNRFLFLAMLFPWLMEAQITADCSGAIVVCGDQLITLEGGPGNPDFNNSNNQLGDCQLTGESESVWLFFRFRTDMPDSSIIEFTIDPVQEGEIDYDFSLYAADTPCDSLGSPVRCSYAWVFSNSTFNCGFCPQTGLGNGEVDETEGPFGNGYLAPLAVYPGQGFYMYVNEFFDDASLSSGFNISFGGSAAPYLDCTVNPNCTEMVVDAGRDSTVCSGDVPFQLIGTATYSTGFETYTWTGTNGEEDFLDDTTSSQPTVTFPLNYSGNIVYVVTVKSGDCVHSDTIRLEVLPTPVFSISGPASFCTGESISLTATPGFDSYQWSNTSTTDRIDVDAGGLYSVTVTAAGNNCAIAKEVEVIEHPLPVVDISGDSILCMGDTVFLDAGPGYDSYNWPSGSGRYLPVTQAGDYTVAVVDTNGCSGNGSRTVLEVALPEPEIAGPGALCPDEQASISVSPAYSDYLWSTGDLTPQFNTSEPGLYTIQVWDEYGCRGVDTLEVNALPGVDPYIFGPDTICYGASTPLAVDPIYESYAWSTGSVASSILADSTGVYSITVTNAEGCAAADTLSLLELPILNVNLNVLGNSVLCTGDTIFLQASSGFESYEWQNGELGPVLPVVSGGSYSVVVSDALGCSETASLNVNEFTPPQPAIDGPPGLCPGVSDTLQVGSYRSFVWSDGSEEPVLHIDTGGAYAVTVTDNNGCIGTASLDVASYTDPQPSVTGPATLCEGLTDTLIVSGGPFASYQWQDNSGEPVLTIDTGGVYSVTVGNAEGCRVTDTFMVELLSQPQVPLPSALSFCENDSLLIDAGPGFAAYIWSVDSVGQSILVSQPGTYSVTVTADNGCSNSQDIDVSSNPLPEPGIIGNLFFCQNTSTTLTLDSGNYNSISWSTGGTLDTETFDNPGAYSVAVTDVNGCTGNYAFMIGELDPTPVTIEGDSLICEGATATLDAGAGYSSYLWSTGATDRSIPVSSQEIVTVTVTNALGCEGSDTLAVQVQPLPEIALLDTMILCEDGDLILDAGADSSYIYIWSGGQNTSSILIDEPGTYGVIVRDAVGCEAAAGVEVLENEVPAPQLDGNLNLCPGDVSVLVVSQPYEAYLWSTGATSDSLEVTQSGFYALTVTDEAGCQGTANILVNDVEAPQASIEGPREICEGATAILDAGNDGTYLWSNGFTGPQLVTSQEGLYYVIVTNSLGCRDTAWAGLMVLPLPDPGLQEDTILCEGGNVLIRADTSFQYYLWDDGSSGPSLEVDAPGIYTLIVSDGTCSGQDTVEVIQQPAPQPVVLGSQIVCPGVEASLQALGDWPALSWSNGDSVSTITVTEPGSYTVVVEDSLGCTGAATGLIENFETTSPAIAGDAGFCPGEVASLGLESPYTIYNWSTGSPAASITVNSPGIYSVTVTDANGCVDWVSQAVYAFAPPQANIGGEVEYCEGDSAQVFAFGDYAAYAWSNGDTTKLTVAYQPGVYSVTVTNSNGCQAVDNVEIIEWPLPQPDILGGQFCPGGSTVLYVEEPFAAYQWQNGADSSSIVVNNAGGYALTVTDFFGCTGSVTAQVEELPLPQPVITGGSPICLGMGATTTIFLNDNYQDIHWSTGEHTSSIEVGSTDTYSVTVTDANGCQGETEFMLETLPAPNLSILGDSAFCQNSSTTLEAVTNGSSLLWSTGATGSQITVDQPDIYFVTAVGSNNCETTDSIQVNVVDLPSFDAGATQAIDCREQPVQLGNSSNPSNGLQYIWSGPGIDEENRNLTMPWVTEPGIYTLEVIDMQYQCNSLPAEVLVDDLRYEPAVVLLPPDTLDCTTPTVTISGQGSAQGDNITYQWYVGSNTPMPGETGLSLTVSGANTYSLLVTDVLTGCSTMAVTEVVDDFSYPQVDAGPEGWLTCDVVSLSLSGRVISASTDLVFSWSTQGGAILNGGSGLTPLIDAPGLYALTAYDPGSGCEATDTVRIWEDVEPPVADAGDNQEIDCVSQEAVLDGSNSSQGPNIQYEWRSETGVPIEGTLHPMVDLPGTYFLTVTNLNNGCSSVDMASVLAVDNYLTGIQVQAVDPLCFDEHNGFIAVTEVQGGTGPFLFSLNGQPFVSQQQFPDLGAGIYDISVQDAMGCEYSLEVYLEDGNDVQVRLGEDREVELGEKITLQALTNLVSEEIRDVIWTFPIDSFPCVDVDCLIREGQLESSTLVRATVVDSNGCSAYDELLLLLRKDRKVYIPNAFSPNGDGPNDHFTIFADEKEVVQVRRLMIMDRWGEQVFSLNNFPPNQPQLGWDGRLRNEPLNPAVFAYFAEIEFVDGEVVLFEGSLTLVR